MVRLVMHIGFCVDEKENGTPTTVHVSCNVRHSCTPKSQNLFSTPQHMQQTLITNLDGYGLRQTKHEE